MTAELDDIKPYTPIRALKRADFEGCSDAFPLQTVCDLVGMSPTFVRKVIGESSAVSPSQLLELLDQDSFSETFIPRSGILQYLQRKQPAPDSAKIDYEKRSVLLKGSAYDLLDRLRAESINCVITSPPYWGTRIYDHSVNVEWGDREVCPYGHEQTPEGYIRHTIEVFVKLKRVLTDDGSIWWNIMDTFNTRTQIRTNAAEALRAMQGKDKTSWGEYECRRYSAGHSFLKDGEQCSIPARIAERASRVGLYNKSVITWAKTGALPEPQNSRVSRSLEYVLHLSKQRTPRFEKEAFKTVPARLGGRNDFEVDKLSDVWFMSTSSGKDGHGAQFALALPGRCIALSTKEDDLVLDPFAGAGTSGIAAVQLGRRFLGFDVSAKYLAVARDQIASVTKVTNGSRIYSANQQELIP
jgi:DNA modification methylase